MFYIATIRDRSLELGEIFTVKLENGYLQEKFHGSTHSQYVYILILPMNKAICIDKIMLLFLASTFDIQTLCISSAF